MVRHLFTRLKDNGITLVFSSIKLQVREVMERTGLYALIGAQYSSALRTRRGKRCTSGSPTNRLMRSIAHCPLRHNPT
ncbi:MAG: hypothetical protein ACREV9_07140 [Burkholderiales bacterium]